MSRNNLIIVVRDKRNHRKTKPVYYIFPDMNADNDWNYRVLRRRIESQNQKWTKNEGLALILAHRMDAKLKTEYGVRIMTLKY